MPTTDTIAARLQRLRTTAGLTQAALAERAGVSLRVVTDLEQGRREDVMLSTAVALAVALGVGVEELAG